MYTGIDIGGTKCSVITGDDNADVIDKIKFDTTTFNETYKMIFDAIRTLGVGKAIGISCGGPLDIKNGIIMSPPNLQGWDNVHIVEALQNEFGVPAYLKNDADAGALAEWKHGAGRNCDNMIFMTFGTGLGAGMILNGRLYTGACDSAGEVGHIRLAGLGPVGYGKLGSFEGFCSGGGIKQIGQTFARKKFQIGERVSYCGSLAELDEITAKSIACCAKRGYEDAREVYSFCGKMLGRGLSVLIDILNPERIVLGSIFQRCEALLRPAMEEIIKEECLAVTAGVCKIVPAELGDSIGDIAALTIAMMGDK